MDESEYFLQQGKYTLAGAGVRSLIDETKSRDKMLQIEKVRSILADRDRFKDVNKKNREENNEWHRLFRNRTAEEIVNSHRQTGCTDIGLVFLSVAREIGVPARYVESFSLDFINDPKQDPISGHIFTDLYFDGEWIRYDPTNFGLVHKKGYWIKDKEYIPIAKGLDFSDLRLMKEEVLGGNHFSLRNVNGFSELRYKISDCINQYKRLNGIAIN